MPADCEFLELGQKNLVTFVLVDSNNQEVSGLGSSFDFLISKNGAAALAGTGVKAEISGLVGWYSYEFTETESTPSGPRSVQADGAGTVLQNLEYVVRGRNTLAEERDYRVLESDLTTPIPDADVYISIDLAGVHLIWEGTSDTFGYARDVNGLKPFLQDGTYYIHVFKEGYTFPVDTEVFS
jgi:hypothetical protein